MFNQFEPHVVATIAFLKSLNVKVNKDTVNETLQNHPDWPSILCITDSLKKWNIPNAVGKIDKEKIDEMPGLFMAFTTDIENPLEIITNITDSTVQLYQKDYKKLITQTKDKFLTRWEGIYLIAEPNEHSIEPNYKTNKQKTFFNNLIPIFKIATLLILSFIILKGTIENLTDKLGTYLQYIILLAGTVVTALLLW